LIVVRASEEALGADHEALGGPDARLSEARCPVVERLRARAAVERAAGACAVRSPTAYVSFGAVRRAGVRYAQYLEVQHRRASMSV
jgi:hypothetical protein